MELIMLWQTGYGSNSYILHSGKEAFVVDASLPLKKYTDELEKHSLTLKGILLTHGHFDHICTSDELRRATGAPLYIHEHDAEMLGDSRKNAYSVFMPSELRISDADVLLKDGDAIRLGNEEIRVIHTPGHTRGSVCYDAGSFILTGDTLFSDGFGRCDLYGGDLRTLKASLSRLSKLSHTDNRPILCGHGEESTLRAAINNIKNYFDI